MSAKDAVRAREAAKIRPPKPKEFAAEQPVD